MDTLTLFLKVLTIGFWIVVILENRRQMKRYGISFWGSIRSAFNPASTMGRTQRFQLIFACCMIIFISAGMIGLVGFAWIKNQ